MITCIATFIGVAATPCDDNGCGRCLPTTFLYLSLKIYKAKVCMTVCPAGSSRQSTQRRLVRRLSRERWRRRRQRGGWRAPRRRQCCRTWKAQRPNTTGRIRYVCVQPQPAKQSCKAWRGGNATRPKACACQILQGAAGLAPFRGIFRACAVEQAVNMHVAVIVCPACPYHLLKAL